MITLSSYIQHFPQDKDVYMLFNRTAAFIDEYTFKVDQDVFMLYDGIVPKHSYSDIYYYMNVLDNYNILKKDVKHIYFCPLFVYNDCIKDTNTYQELNKQINTLLYIKNHENQNVIENLFMNVEYITIHRKDLRQHNFVYEYSYYDMRFEPILRFEYLFPIFLRSDKMLLHVLSTTMFKNSQSQFFNLLENIFNFTITEYSNELFLIDTTQMNVENFNLFVTYDDNIRRKIIEDIVTKNMIDFNTFQDVLNYLKGVVEYCLS